jgi:hypothetical protein
MNSDGLITRRSHRGSRRSKSPVLSTAQIAAQAVLVRSSEAIIIIRMDYYDIDPYLTDRG